MTKQVKADPKRVVLGSGENYLLTRDENFTFSSVDDLIEKVFTPANRWGDTKNGASITYTPTVQTVNDDLGYVVESFLVKEEVKLSMGLVTINSSILLPLIETAQEVESTKDGRKIIKIGGLANAKNKYYVIGFRHVDKEKGDLYIIIVGKNDGELQLSFNPESETILNPTFTAGTIDSEGTKLIIAIDNKKGVSA